MLPPPAVSAGRSCCIIVWANHFSLLRKKIKKNLQVTALKAEKNKDNSFWQAGLQLQEGRWCPDGDLSPGGFVTSGFCLAVPCGFSHSLSFFFVFPYTRGLSPLLSLEGQCER